jgi:DNA-binding CsgD family transcriptional regulator
MFGESDIVFSGFRYFGIFKNTKTMREATLTQRENEVAELLAWGATKKEVAQRLYVSVRTVENHARNIYEKSGVTKASELAAWWFCMKFGISFDLNPMKRRAVAWMMLALITFGMSQGQDIQRARAVTRTARVTRVMRRVEN